MREHETYEHEADLLRDANRWCRENKIFSMRLCDYAHRGYPDLVLVVEGIFIAVELKTESYHPSRHQLTFIEKLQAAGGLGKVCYNIADIKGLVEEAKRRGRRTDSC